MFLDDEVVMDIATNHKCRIIKKEKRLFSRLNSYLNPQKYIVVDLETKKIRAKLESELRRIDDRIPPCEDDIPQDRNKPLAELLNEKILIPPQVGVMYKITTRSPKFINGKKPKGKIGAGKSVRRIKKK